MKDNDFLKFWGCVAIVVCAGISLLAFFDSGNQAWEAHKEISAYEEQYEQREEALRLEMEREEEAHREQARLEQEEEEGESSASSSDNEGAWAIGTIVFLGFLMLLIWPYLNPFRDG